MNVNTIRRANHEANTPLDSGKIRLHRLTMSELRGLYSHYFGFEHRTLSYSMNRHELVRVLAPELDGERWA